MEIAYQIVDSPLGRMLVAATKRGICAVTFGESDEELAKELSGEFPAARITPVQEGEGALAAWINDMLEHLSGQMPRLDLPLDVQATAFRLKVWEVLRQVPYGETRTYTELAQAVGRPDAVRAVANACAANPTAVITPCHRILRADGSLGGYRWGLDRKKALLEMERAKKR